MKALFFILLFFGYSAAVFAGSPETVRLRLRWGGVDSPAFGEVQCESGTLSDLSPISMDPECPGGAWLVNGNVQIRQSVAKKYNGFDVTVPYRPDANLLVQIGAEADYSSAARFAIPLREIIRSGKTAPLAEGSKFQFSVSRVPGDDLRVQMDRDNLVFAPRDMFQCTVTPALCWEPPVRPGHKILPVEKQETIPQTNEIGVLEFSVFRGRETFRVHSGSIENVHLDGTMPAQIHFPVPENEGVYDVVLKLRKGPGGKNLLHSLGNTLSGRSADDDVLAERRVQFLVLNDGTVSAAAPGNYTLKLEIDPSDPEWWNRLDREQLRQLESWVPNTASLQNGTPKVFPCEKQNFIASGTASGRQSILESVSAARRKSRNAARPRSRISCEHGADVQFKHHGTQCSRSDRAAGDRFRDQCIVPDRHFKAGCDPSGQTPHPVLAAEQNADPSDGEPSRTKVSIHRKDPSLPCGKPFCPQNSRRTHERLRLRNTQRHSFRGIARSWHRNRNRSKYRSGPLNIQSFQSGKKTSCCAFDRQADVFADLFLHRDEQ